jgi:hypothetical protein
MADNRTVYLTDDHPNGVLLRFVADRPNDLSSGTLSAAKFSGQRLDPSGRPTWDLGWVTLGRGNQTYLDALARSPLRFTDIFDVAPPEGSPPRCPPGFLPASQPSALYKHVDARTLAAYFIECLRARPGMAAAAAFLEPRRYASMLGATAEFDRLDGLTWSRRLRQLYFTGAPARGCCVCCPFDVICCWTSRRFKKPHTTTTIPKHTCHRRAHPLRRHGPAALQPRGCVRKRGGRKAVSLVLSKVAFCCH